MVRGDAQPHSTEKVSGTSRLTRNPPSSTDPSTSRRGPGTRSLRGSMNQPQTSTTIPMGRLIRKIQRQPMESAMKPPSGGPTVRPMYTAMTLMPRARPRSCGGKTAGDDRGRRRPDERGAGPLDDAGRDEPGAVPAERAQQRGDA